MPLLTVMIVAVRCAPHQSWTNLAERCMSILNLALQNVALQRESMPEEFEKCASDVSSLSELRNLASSKPEFKAAYLQSMQPVIDLLNGRFTRMKLKDSPLSTLLVPVKMTFRRCLMRFIKLIMSSR